MPFAKTFFFILFFTPAWALGLLRHGLLALGALLLLVTSTLPSAQTLRLGAASAVVTTEQVQAELIAHAPDGFGTGKPVQLGLRIRHQPHWHTYWKNPGDSGLPTQLQWTLPAGVTASAIDWPAPRKITIGSLANFGYEDTVLLPVTLTIGPQFAAQGAHATVALAASWLVCKEECVPQEGNFTLQIPTQSSTALHGEAFAAARALAPQALQGEASAQLDGQLLRLQVRGLPAAWQGQALDWFPETPEIVAAPRIPTAADAIAAQPASGSQSWSDGIWSAVLPLSSLRTESPSTLPFVLVAGSQSLRGEAGVQGVWPAAAPMPPPPLPSTAPAVSPPTDSMGWALALGAALLGGLILNLMPCVLPVLAIKVLAFSTPGKSAQSHRAEGLAYTGGVVLSFLALGALVLGLRAAGEQLGWGFQLQSPAVVAALALLFTLIGLNLMGLLEWRLVLPGNLAAMQLRHPVGDAFLSGVLVVAVASPCTAPFMGASLGYALALPAAQALSIFAALGLGLALPYLLASWAPRALAWLPRPGAWMDTLKRFLAFPMWATVLWLVWVLGHLVGVDAAASLLALLLAVSLLVWSLGLGGRSRAVLGAFSLVLLLALGWALGGNVLQADDLDSSTAADRAGSAANPGASLAAASAGVNGQWQAWSPERVQRALSQGQPVFVDFTAAWCITCQLNKKTTLSDPDVLDDFAKRNVLLLRADWTRRDPLITQALGALGRSGVPVYVLHKPQGAPVVMSEILRASEVRAALATQ